MDDSKYYYKERSDLNMDQPNLLGNKLRQMRMENNLTVQAVADQINLSHVFISMLERGIRGASDDTLKKYADFFHCDFNVLKEFQKTVYIESETVETTNIPNYLVEYNSLIMNFNEDYRHQYVTEQIENLRSRFFNSLTSYNLNDIKKVANKIRRGWYGCGEVVESFDTQVLVGTLQIPDKHIYFKMDVSEQTCSLQLLYEDHKHVDLLKTWLSEENVSLVITDEIIHLEEKQKLKKYFWFSPSLSIKDQLRFLIEEKMPLDNMIYRDNQLHLSIKYYLEHKVNVIEEDVTN